MARTTLNKNPLTEEKVKSEIAKEVLEAFDALKTNKLSRQLIDIDGVPCSLGALFIHKLGGAYKGPIIFTEQQKAIVDLNDANGWDEDKSDRYKRVRKALEEITKNNDN